MRKLLAIAALTTCSLLAQTSSTAADPLAPLDFLLGTWSAKTTGGGAGADSSGSYTFSRDLNGHELTRTSSADHCHGPATFDCRHHDQFFIFSDPNARAAHGSSLLAFYADSEGHVIYYTATMPDANTVVFDSHDAPGTPKFRLVYHRDGNAMTGKFQMAAPGSDDFHSYLEWAGTKLPPSMTLKNP